MLAFIDNTEDMNIDKEAAALANYFETVYDIANEGMTELSAKTKETVIKFASKIRDFIAKAVKWIKEKFYTFLKVDTITIHQNLWKNANMLLKEIDGIKLGYLDTFKWSYAYGNIAADTMVGSNNASDAQIETVTSKNKELHDKITKIQTSSEYVSLGNSDDSSPMTVVHVSTLSNLNSKLASQLKTMQDSAAQYEKYANSNYTNGRQFAAVNDSLNISIRKFSMEMHIISTIMASSQRSNAKNANTNKLYDVK